MSDVEVRAANARALQENPLWVEILTQVKAEAVNAWVGTPAADGQPAREFAWMLYKAVGRIEGVIQGAIDDQRVQASRATVPLR